MIRRHRQGLTLLELVIAMAVLAVLSALALPALGSRLQQHRLDAAAEALVADINEARFEAARQGRSLHLVMQPGPAWCWSVASTASCPCGLAQSCELRHARGENHAGVVLAQGSPLQLLATGQADHPVQALLESRNGRQLRVDVLSMGRARICATRGGSTRYPAC